MTREDLQDLQDLCTLKNYDTDMCDYAKECFNILMFLNLIEGIENIKFRWKFYERVDNNLLNQSKILSFFDLNELTIKCFREKYMTFHNTTYENFIKDHYLILITLKYDEVFEIFRTFDEEFWIYFTYNNKNYEIEQNDWYKELNFLMNNDYSLDKFLTIITGEKYEKKY